MHAVYSGEKDIVWTRQISCYCDECYRDPRLTTCDGWEKHHLKRNITPLRAPAPDIPATAVTTAPQSLPHDTPEIQHRDSGNKRDSMFDISVGDWVAAAEYDRQRYIGEVIDIEDNDYLINFLEKSG